MKKALIIAVVLGLCLTQIVPVYGQGQYREYYIYGKVTDTENNPLNKVKINLKDTNTNRKYGTKSNKDGEFKLAGLPHGVYEVAMILDGFQVRTDEWRFEAPQTRMQKVDVKTTVMVSQAKLLEIERSKTVEGWFKEATEKVRKQDFDGAQLLLDKMLAQNPDDANARYLMGLCFMNRQKIAEAIEQFQAVIKATPAFAGAHYQLGIGFQKNGQMDKALESYKKALELEPGNMVSLYNSGIILYESDRTEEAVAYFKKALQLKPGAPEILEMAGLCYLKLEQYDNALDFLGKAVEASKDPRKVKSLGELVNDLKLQLNVK